MSSIYNKTKSGFCRICGNCKKFSEDHIPPEKCFNESTVFVSKPYKTSIDKGLKIQSICSDCNNAILGGNYDNELKVFVHEINKYYKLRFVNNIVFGKAAIRINKKRVARAILGHILSCYGTQDELRLPFDKDLDCYSNRMRKYVLGEENHFEKEIKILFWIHPYRIIKVIPHCVFTELTNSETSLPGSVFSFYPIGIWVINKDNYNLVKQVNHKVNEFVVDDEETIELNIDIIKDEDFPFSILKNNNGVAFLFNEKGIIHGLKSEYYNNSEIKRVGTY